MPTFKSLPPSVLRSGVAFTRRRALAGLGAGAAFFGGLLRSVRVEAAPNNARAVFFFHANGSHHAWTPMGNGEAFTLTPHLAPLEPVRKDVVILRGLTMARGAGNATSEKPQPGRS